MFGSGFIDHIIVTGKPLSPGWDLSDFFASPNFLLTPEYGYSNGLSGFGSAPINLPEKFDLTDLWNAFEATKKGSIERHEAAVSIAGYNGIGVKDEGKKDVIDGLDADLKNIDHKLVTKFDEIREGWDKASDEPIVVTSGREGRHKTKSKHYEGLAIDLRGRHLEYNRENPHDQKAHEIHDVAQAIQNELGENYDVVVEIFQDNPARNHIHIEYDPSGADDPNWHEVAVDVY